MNKLSVSFLSLLLIASITACNKTTKIEREVVTPANTTSTQTTVDDNGSVKTEVKTDDVNVTTEIK